MALSREVDPTDVLKKNLAEMPHSIVQFSQGLRRLYAQDAVSTVSKNTASFRQIRDLVRKDAVLYSAHVLPLALAVIGNISAYFDNYLALEYNDWLEYLDEIIQEVEGYTNECRKLQQMHEQLIFRLKERHNEAQLSIFQMDQLSYDMADRVKDLQDKAKYYEDQSNSLVMAGVVGTAVAGLDLALAPVTRGASLAAAAVAYTATSLTSSDMLKAKSRVSLAKAVAEENNAKIMREAAHLTSQVLIPAIEHFLHGMQACNTFFVVTRKNLGEVKNNNTAAKGKKMGEGKIKREFLIMKKKAKDINTLCDSFFFAASEVRIDKNC